MYLLSTQSLMDLICGQPAMASWIRSVGASEVHISSVSIAQIEAEILATSAADGRDELDDALRSILAYARRARAIELFDEEAAAIFARLPEADLYFEDGTVVGDMTRMVAATAIEKKLMLVEEPQPYHAVIANLLTAEPS